MKAICGECRTRIATDLSGKNWHHLTYPAATHEPWPRKGTVEHACTIPDPYCPGCTPEAVEEWRRTRTPV